MMSKRGRRAGRHASAARGTVILAIAAAVVCLTALGGWMVWQEKGNPSRAQVMDAAASGTVLSDAEGGQTGTGRSGSGLTDSSAHSAQTESSQAQNMQTENLQTENPQPDPVIELTTAAGPETASEKNVAEAGNTAGAQNSAEDTDTSGQIGEETGDITLLFAGDVYFSDHVMNAYNQAGSIAGVLDEGIRAEIGAADIFMVNQEFPFTNRGTAAEDKQFTFRIPPEKVSMLTEMGVDIVTMANNHILDFGPEGITDSLAALDGAGIPHVGAGENLEQAKKLEILEVKGKKIGFLGVSRVYMAASWAAGADHPGVFSTYDPTMAMQEIRAARTKCDYLVVYVHWGIERNTAPEDYQRSMGRQYIDAGADLVVGSHPHVLQEIESYNGRPIAYSLGNFVFGSSIPETELLKVVLKGGQTGQAAADAQAAAGRGENGADGNGAEAAGPDLEVEVTTIPCTSSGGYTRLR